MSVPAGVDEAGRRVNEQTETAQRALALQSRDEIVGQPHALERRAEHELAGVEDERLVAVHLDQLGQVLLSLLDVDERIARVAEDAEVAVDAHVDARRLEERFVVGLDADAPFGEQAPDRAVGKDHARILAECDLAFGSLSVLTPVDRNDRRRRRRRASRRRYMIRRFGALAIVVVLGAGFAFGAHSLTGGRGANEAAVGPDAKAKPGPRNKPRAPCRARCAASTSRWRSQACTASSRNISAQAGGPEHDRARRQGRERRDRLRPRRAAARACHRRGEAVLQRPRAARKIHAAGLYLIGRVVTFQDPLVSERRPGLALHNADGSVWHTSAGYGWLNPYDRRVWNYDLGVATAAAKAGFDEIQFDYVRFPSDGDVARFATRCARRLPRRRRSRSSSSSPRESCTSATYGRPWTSSVSRRHAISGSGRSRAASRGTWTPSTRWSTRHISTRARTESPIRMPTRGRR